MKKKENRKYKGPKYLAILPRGEEMVAGTEKEILETIQIWLDMKTPLKEIKVYEVGQERIINYIHKIELAKVN